MKTRKKWSILVAVMMALVILTMSIVPAMAQDDAVSLAAAEPSYSVRDGLAIIVPLGAPVNTPVTMTVLKRSDASPVEGAGVWALTPDNAEILRQRLTAMQESGEISSTDVDWDAIVQVYGWFLGRTDERGKLSASFDEPGHYVVLAVKRGYVPGRSSTVIGGGLKALELRASNRAKVGERVTMTVLQKGTGNPIAGAGIWALTRDQAEAFKQDVEAMKTDATLASEDFDWESIVSIRGTFLGRTGENGELVTAFSETGGYLLVAVKRGYVPARHGIYIYDKPKAMTLRVPQSAEVGDIVPIHVSETNTGAPVMGAGVWALTREQAAAFRQNMAGVREQGQNLQDTDWESVVSIHGVFLGRTDERGYLEASFGVPGGYLLVSVKPGYIPGFGFIFIKQPKPELEMDSVKLHPQKVQEPEPDNTFTTDNNS
jgi:hypothetical protein